MSPDERSELERLRGEVASLRAAPAAAPRRRIGWRAPVASVLIVIGCVLAPLSVIGVWAGNEVSNTDRYVANVTPLISDPSVQRALTDRVSTAITTRLDVAKLTKDAAASLSQRGLTRAGDLLNSVSGSVAGAVNGFIHSQVATIIASPQVATLWVQLNRKAHAQVVKVLSGQGSATLTVVNGQVTLNLGPIIDQVKKDLSARGLPLVDKLPAINPTYPLFSATQLEKARSLYNLLNTLKIVLPILAVVLLALGVYAARGHRRALLGTALGVSASMLVLGIALAIFRSVYLDSLPPDVSGAAAGAAFDILVRFLKDALRALLVAGLVVAVAAFFTGPSVTAVRTRSGITSGLRWIRERGERAGVSTGPVGRWTYTHRKALRVAAAAIAALVFVFWSPPTATLAIVTAIVLLAVLGLIELIGRPPPPQAAGHPRES